jgi:hypothetical protein
VAGLSYALSSSVILPLPTSVGGGFSFGERNLLQRRGLGLGGGCRFDVTLCLTSTYNYFQNILKVG